MTDFYLRALRRAGIEPTDTVLVVCGERYDRDQCLAAGIQHATISNIYDEEDVSEHAPYPWERLDAENIAHPDGSFDWVTVSAGLHHCASPHRALCEMLRVSRKGIVAVESRDGLLMRAAVKLGLTPDFEFEPVMLSNGTTGGRRNTSIPNYIYRWTEREVIKTASSYLPNVLLEHQFAYGYRFPFQRVAMSRSQLKRTVITLLFSLKWLFEKAIPRQGNQFAFIIKRTGRTPPWIKDDGTGTTVDLDYMRQRYDPEKYPE